MKVLEDGSDGIIIEIKDGKEIVKAGRLYRLVEKLADHNMPNVEYRNVHLLVHISFFYERKRTLRFAD